MDRVQKEFDVAKNLKMTESIQCSILSGVSDLFLAMNKKNSKMEQIEVLAQIQMDTFLLAGKLGISKESLDKKTIAKLKVNLLEEERPEWKSALLETLNAMK